MQKYKLPKPEEPRNVTMLRSRTGNVLANFWRRRLETSEEFDDSYLSPNDLPQPSQGIQKRSRRDKAKDYSYNRRKYSTRPAVKYTEEAPPEPTPTPQPTKRIPKWKQALMKREQENKPADIYTKMGSYVQDLLAGQKVWNERAPSPTKKLIYNTRREVDTEMYTKKSVQAREALRRSPAICEAMEEWWELIPKENKCFITKSTYLDYNYALLTELSPQSSQENCEKILEDDWRYDSRGNNKLDQTLFYDSLFDFVDMWTDGLAEADYVHLLQKYFKYLKKVFPEEEDAKELSLSKSWRRPRGPDEQKEGEENQEEEGYGHGHRRPSGFHSSQPMMLSKPRRGKGGPNPHLASPQTRTNIGPTSDLIHFVRTQRRRSGNWTGSDNTFKKLHGNTLTDYKGAAVPPSPATPDTNDFFSNDLPPDAPLPSDLFGSSGGGVPASLSTGSNLSKYSKLYETDDAEARAEQREQNAFARSWETKGKKTRALGMMLGSVF
eukprot:TRINITY_DN104904_c0_g1_i1.p1 TRINITY_DN104904_c0_g1~~TRINITY_DN104904_c0_g1_i1.p1  ORF type:complete len:494 (+),score=50.11 TRINITY_DN104904_c0_g1_i1:136-1617(+)